MFESGEKKHCAPLGTPFVQARLTVCGMPLVHVTVIVLLPPLPCSAEIWPEFARLKSKLLAWAGRTARLSVIAWARSRRMVAVFA